jgi:hypothetical protein
MPRSKKARANGPQRGDGPGFRGARKMHTFSRLSTSAGPSSISKTQKGGIGNNGTAEKNKKNPAQHRRPIVPFGRRDRILLVGEGERFLFLYFPTTFKLYFSFWWFSFSNTWSVQSPSVNVVLPIYIRFMCLSDRVRRASMVPHVLICEGTRRVGFVEFIVY